MRVPCRTLTLAVCAWLLVSCARSTFQRDLAELQREKAAEREEWQQQAELLSRRGEVNTVLAAALIEYAELKRSERALALLARALELETARPEIAWIDLRLCQEVASCDTRSRVTRLQSIDPENAAGGTASFAERRKQATYRQRMQHWREWVPPRGSTFTGTARS